MSSADMEFTKAHLRKWIEHVIPEYLDRETLFSAMLTVFASDPDYWSDKGWPAVERQVEDYK